VTYWYVQAANFLRVGPAHDRWRARDYIDRRLAQGHPPDAMNLPQHFDRVDKWLPEIADRLTAVYSELLALPGDLDAALHVRFSEYEKALNYLAILPEMLNTMADAWHRPRPGQPSLEIESNAVGLLINAVEDFTGKEFPSPRSYKHLFEIEFVYVLAGRLFPSFTRSKIDTMLRHFHERRLSEERAEHSSRKGKKVYSIRLYSALNTRNRDDVT